ncbi:MAG: hypothetical protein AABM67_00650 [Acidobacteriota bacterium]
MKPIYILVLVIVCAASVLAQQPAEQRSGLNESPTALDAKGAAALEGRLLSTVLNGSDDSPVTNARIAIKNVSPNFYTYVTGWATFYDSNAVRCGEGLFKLDALAPGESAETDTPGLRLRCAPASWRIVATNLLTRTYDAAKPAEASAPPVEPPVVERPAPVNFIITIDGAQYPIQINNPLVLKMGNRNRKIVLRPAP